MRKRVSQSVIALAAGLWLAHVGSVTVLGTTHRGALSSDLIQLIFGLMLIPVTLWTALRSRGVGRHYWCIAALAYSLLVFAQALSVFQDLLITSTLPEWVTFLFSFWSVALGMSLLIDPESGAETLDPLTYLDFIQGILFLLGAYFYFVLPSKSQAGGDLAGSVRTPYVIYNILLAGAFFFRSALATNFGAKFFLRRMGLYMVASCLVDALYYYGPGRSLRTGAWFDLLWSGLLVIPVVFAASWGGPETSSTEDPRAAARNQLLTQLFALIFPVLIVIMSLRISQERLILASTLVLVSLACSSARLLLTQKRLVIAQESLRREATHDGLTGIWNHAAILETLDRELLRALRENGSVAIMMIDVDKFKAINDSHGHAAGDTVLRTLTGQIAEVLRSYDSLGRYGGEEFLVIAPGCDVAACRELAERVRAHIAGHPIHIRGGSIQVTISIGVAASSEGMFSSELLLQSADSALYRAKDSGRNRVEFLVPAPAR